MQTQAPCPTCQGFGSTIAQPCTECSGAGRIPTRRTLNINIPAGASEGTQIRVSGEAEVGQGGGPNGDLYLLIREKKHPRVRSPRRRPAHVDHDPDDHGGAGHRV